MILSREPESIQNLIKGEKYGHSFVDDQIRDNEPLSILEYKDPKRNYEKVYVIVFDVGQIIDVLSSKFVAEAKIIHHFPHGAEIIK